MQRQARTRRAGIDTRYQLHLPGLSWAMGRYLVPSALIISVSVSNVINGLAATRSKRARKAVNYNYDEKELDKAIREYNAERNRAADDDESDGDEHQRTLRPLSVVSHRCSEVLTLLYGVLQRQKVHEVRAGLPIDRSESDQAVSDCYEEH